MFERNLYDLFSKIPCPECGELFNTVGKNKRKMGTILKLRGVCKNHHVFYWNSQPRWYEPSTRTFIIILMYGTWPNRLAKNWTRKFLKSVTAPLGHGSRRSRTMFGLLLCMPRVTLMCWERFGRQYFTMCRIFMTGPTNHIFIRVTMLPLPKKNRGRRNGYNQTLMLCDHCRLLSWRRNFWRM